MSRFTESEAEAAALAWLESLGWQIAYGPEVAPGEPLAERDDYREVALPRRLMDALAAHNPNLPHTALEEAARRLTHPEGATLEARNRAFHNMLVTGIPVEVRRPDGSIRGARVWAVDFDHPEANDFLAINQFTVVEGQHQRRPDIVLFVNGLPLAIIEMKNPADEKATIWTAYNQFQTYKAELPSLFALNELLVISDGLEARVGTLTAGREWFKPWRTIGGEHIEDEGVPQLEVLLKGIFDTRTGRGASRSQGSAPLLDMLRDFIVFEDDGGRVSKKAAGYHQFHAVRVAVQETLRAAGVALTGDIAEGQGRYETGRKPGGKPGDGRIGVVWHTQGSGKSLTMLFYAARIAREQAMQNPTIVVLTDRNDLDDQLFGVFSRGSDLLRQRPIHASSRENLQRLLAERQSGGVIFTTIQKFFPETRGARYPTLSQRRNIVVMADEAHRSQYGFIDGFARHMRDALPNASFIAFTGTPLELEDRNTRQIFGDYIAVYDIQRAVADGATVPIYYESRLAKLRLPDALKPQIDEAFEEVTEREETERKERLKTRWAQLEAIVGAPPRLQLVASDIVQHFEKRLEALEGKAMIVTMSRRIAVEMYNEIVRLRPEWHSEDDDKGMIKVVMTGSASDPVTWQPHIRNKARRDTIARRFRDPDDPLKIVIVRDMWLTGFDCPPLHTLYIDKPMRGHTLMQAIARVNRVFRDKPGGLVVDYIGLAHDLKRALETYTRSGGTGRTAIDQEEAVTVMQEKYEICRDFFHGFDWSAWHTDDPQARLRLLPPAQDHILAQPQGKERFVQAVRALSKAFALAMPHTEALRIQDDVAFFQAVRAALVKRSPTERTAPTDEELDHAIREIVAQAVAPEGVMDIFAAAGLNKPDISILSEDFLAEVRGMPHKNLAVELLRKLLEDEIRTRRRKNIVQARRFSELLEQAILRYQNRAVEASQVIEELIALAREMRSADQRGEHLGLGEEELAFYDALADNESAREVLGDETLRQIAQELVRIVRENTTIDWAHRENVRAHLRVLVKRILRKYGYPPDKQARATQLVLKQAELLTQQ